MIALSIQQPWAWLIVNGHKDIENRDWRAAPRFRGRFLIHAGKRPDADAIRDMAFIRDMIGFLPPSDVFKFGGIVGEAELVAVVRESASPWFFGPLGFVLRNAKPLPFYACRGQLGFFDAEEAAE